MKISRRNFLKVLGSATMAGALAACGGSSSTSAAVSGAASTAAAAAPGTTYTMNIGSGMSASHPSIVAMQSFEKAVEERTNGGIQVEIYTDSALGGESDLIEQVRGVDSSSSVSGLLEKGLIEEAGRLDLPGRPVAFRTTDVFLRCFGLSSLDDLPPIHSSEESGGEV